MVLEPICKAFEALFVKSINWIVPSLRPIHFLLPNVSTVGDPNKAFLSIYDRSAWT